ncbi:hypothetical protein D9M72_514970 [compost metagenome]
MADDSALDDDNVVVVDPLINQFLPGGLFQGPHSFCQLLSGFRIKNSLDSGAFNRPKIRETHAKS